MNSKLDLHINTSINLIRGSAPGKVTVQNTEYTSSVIVTPNQVINWPIPNVDVLTSEDFEPIIALNDSLELIVLGTGKMIKFLQASQTKSLISAQIGLEVMDTPAACRTYNVLADEGRHVIACLIV